MQPLLLTFIMKQALKENVYLLKRLLQIYIGQKIICTFA